MELFTNPTAKKVKRVGNIGSDTLSRGGLEIGDRLAESKRKTSEFYMPFYSDVVENPVLLFRTVIVLYVPQIKIALFIIRRQFGK